MILDKVHYILYDEISKYPLVKLIEELSYYPSLRKDGT